MYQWDRVQGNATEVTGGRGNMMHGERLMRPGLFSLEYYSPLSSGLFLKDLEDLSKESNFLYPLDLPMNKISLKRYTLAGELI